MAAIDDELAGAAIAARVGSFYESHPYPPPVDSLEAYAEKWDDERRRSDAHLFWPGEPYRDDRSILVAGCGTSQAAKYALRWPNARVIGIDFSAASIEHTAKLKRKHSIQNLELQHLPVERAGELGRRFDHVVCTGVLHHLPDPDIGLRALRDILEPNGAIQLMVYAPYGRAGVYLIQDYCRRLGITASDAEIQDLVTSLRPLPQDHPLVPLLRHSPDFGKPAGLADALLHPQDRAYSVPQLFDFLDRAGLTFGRWIRQAPYLPQCGGPAVMPHGVRLVRLPAEEQYAAMELFRGTMTRHTVAAYRNDGQVNAEIDFESDAWLNYIPHGVPDTIIVREGLPAGAAAVLINQTHTYTDLYVPIDAAEETMLEAVDGLSTIADIARAAGTRDAARGFFQRLWRYDQVVFDTSS